MTIVCPTITATNAQEYREQMARVAPFAKRVHIDFSDGEFAPVKLVNVIQAYWPEKMTADFHLMFKRPLEHVETVISLNPNLAVVHAEAEGDLIGLLRQFKSVNIKAGVALLQATQPDAYHDLIVEADHVLIFSGNLGHHGGSVADMNLLSKINVIHSINPMVEIGWDGGINAENISKLALSGAEVFNVGGAIVDATDPKDAFEQISKALAVIDN